MRSHSDQGSVVLTLLIGFTVVSTILAGLTALVPTLWRHAVGFGEHGLALETAESGLVHAQAWLQEHSLSHFDSYPYNSKENAHVIDPDSSFFVTYDSSRGSLVATGRYGKSTRQLSLWVHEEPAGNAEMEFTQALYAAIGTVPGKPAIELTGSSKIIGDVTINAAHDGSVRLAWSTTIDGDLTLGPDADPSRVIDGAQPYQNHIAGLVHTLPQVTEFVLPEYPEFPNDMPNRGNLISGGNSRLNVAASGRYNILQVSGSSTLTFDLTKGDLHIRAKELRVTGNAHVYLKKNSGSDNGKLFLYVEDVFELSGSSTINAHGDPGDVFMYYSGGGKLSVPGATDYVGSVYVQKAALEINGSGGILGNIISGGPSITVNGDSSAVVRVMYAPLANIVVTGSSTIRGSIVGYTLTGTGNVRIYYEKVNMDMPITIPAPGGSDGNGGTGSIMFYDWRVL